MMNSVADVFRLVLILVPCISLLSANLYFYLFASQVDIVTAGLFGVQDHFDKAVDFLIPVLIGVLPAMAGMVVLDERVNSAEWIKHVNTRVSLRSRYKLVFVTGSVFSILGSILLWLLPFERMWFAIAFFAPGISPFVAVYSRFLARRYSRWNSQIAFDAAFAVSGGIIFLTVFVFVQTSSVLRHAKEQYFTNGTRSILETTSLGLLAIERGSYVLIGVEGQIVVEGKTITPVSKSYACRIGWSWTCSWSIDYRNG